jgi:hypothetical protein
VGSNWNHRSGLTAVAVGAVLYVLFVWTINKNQFPSYAGDRIFFAAIYLVIGGGLYWLFARPERPTK